jgi:hypothetical protein
LREADDAEQFHWGNNRSTAKMTIPNRVRISLIRRIFISPRWERRTGSKPDCEYGYNEITREQTGDAKDDKSVKTKQI